jgi:hypothetical protein
MASQVTSIYEFPLLIISKVSYKKSRMKEEEEEED